MHAAQKCSRPGRGRLPRRMADRPRRGAVALPALRRIAIHVSVSCRWSLFSSGLFSCRSVSSFGERAGNATGLRPCPPCGGAAPPLHAPSTLSCRMHVSGRHAKHIRNAGLDSENYGRSLFLRFLLAGPAHGQRAHPTAQGFFDFAEEAVAPQRPSSGAHGTQRGRNVRVVRARQFLRLVA